MSGPVKLPSSASLGLLQQISKQNSPKQQDLCIEIRRETDQIHRPCLSKELPLEGARGKWTSPAGHAPSRASHAPRARGAKECRFPTPPRPPPPARDNGLAQRDRLSLPPPARAKWFEPTEWNVPSRSSPASPPHSWAVGRIRLTGLSPRPSPQGSAAQLRVSAPGTHHRLESVNRRLHVESLTLLRRRHAHLPFAEPAPRKRDGASYWSAVTRNAARLAARKGISEPIGRHDWVSPGDERGAPIR